MKHAPTYRAVLSAPVSKLQSTLTIIVWLAVFLFASNLDWQEKHQAHRPAAAVSR